jgi:DNA replication protein DnaC
MFTSTFRELQRAQADYVLAKALTRLDRFALLVIDDFSHARKDGAETSGPFELVIAQL